MLYKYPKIYSGTMRLLYGKHLRTKYQSVAQHIDAGCSVLDICCGPCPLFEHLPLGNREKYLGLDNSLAFIQHAQIRKIPVKFTNVLNEDLPSGFEVIVLGSSLYQFFPHVQNFLEKLLTASEHLVIISEPIKNISQSSNILIKKLAQKLTRPSSDQKYQGYRFNDVSLSQALNPFSSVIESREISANGREVIYVLNAKKWKLRQ